MLPGPASPTAAPANETAFAGNVSTHKFHKRGCRYYSCSNCTAKFATREEAIAAGFRPCGTCLP
jgi:methylphosphotriester-DNA--protein-cysteine methyltransferase